MKEKDLWNEVKKWLLTLDIDPDVYDTYLKNGTLSMYDDAKVAITTSSFGKTILKDYRAKVNEKINDLLQKDVEFDFLTKDELSQKKNIKKIQAQKQKVIETFDNFILGPSNQQAFNAVRSIVYENYGKWNPLFLYGNSGLGKTHLLRAAKHEIKTKTEMKAIYVDSTEFRNNFVKALQGGATSFDAVEKFKEKYTDTDFLFIDDIQFLASSSKTNEVLFTIFNTLINNNRQIILTSDKTPESLNGFDVRFISRFNGGLNLQIKALDKTTSLNILKYLLKVVNVEMDEDAQNHIASYYANDVRKISSIVSQIEFHIIQNNMTHHVTLQDVEPLLSNYVVISDGKLTPLDIKNVVAKEYNTNLKLLEGKTRVQPLTFARHLAMYLMHDLLNINYTEIGNHFGGRDHSTVLNGIGKVEEKLKADKEFEKLVKKIKKNLSK